MPKMKINLGLNEKEAQALHRVLKAEFQKGGAQDEILRTWFRLDNTMKRRGIVIE